MKSGSKKMADSFASSAGKNTTPYQKALPRIYSAKADSRKNTNNRSFLPAIHVTASTCMGCSANNAVATYEKRSDFEMIFAM